MSLSPTHPPLANTVLGTASHFSRNMAKDVESVQQSPSKQLRKARGSVALYQETKPRASPAVKLFKACWARSLLRYATTSVTKNDSYDTQHFSLQQAIHIVCISFLQFFTVTEDSNLARALPLPSVRGCCGGASGGIAKTPNAAAEHSLSLPSAQLQPPHCTAPAACTVPRSHAVSHQCRGVCRTQRNYL